MSIARTDATGTAMLPELVDWSSSFVQDRAFFAHDVVGSAAHATMLGKTGLIPKEDARALVKELLAMAAGQVVADSHEEDVHMAVEAELTRRLGPQVAGRLHTARSRNDQVALDLRLFAREEAAALLGAAARLAIDLTERGAREMDVLLPAYTHRQRAQPISGAFLVAAWASDLVRAAETVAFALDRASELPLGSGACSGTSLPIDRDLVRRLLRFERLSVNALDTVGDRGFALDLVWGAARVVLALAKIAGDVVDMSTSEFGLVRLGGEIAAGSSMMPQKKNPDIFELARGKSAGAVADVVHMLTLVKGLPSGYNRDQQEDRRALLEAGPRARGAVRALALSLPHVAFDGARGRAALDDGFTQATDLAEALVRRGVPFREAYKAVGALVRAALEAGLPLTKMGDRAKAIHPELDAAALAALDPARAVAAKESPGGTGPRAVAAQLAHLRARAGALVVTSATAAGGGAHGFSAAELARGIENEAW
jgi:argininosuccinate lyase